MSRSTHQLAWALAACAAIAAQVMPRSVCHACGHSCCAAVPVGRGPTAADATIESKWQPDGESASRCPHCSPPVDLRPNAANERPCHCQLNPRHDQPLPPTQHTLKASADVRPATTAAVATPLVPPAIGVSREYLAASLTVPIRPPRILFGVRRE